VLPIMSVGDPPPVQVDGTSCGDTDGLTLLGVVRFRAERERRL